MACSLMVAVASVVAQPVLAEDLASSSVLTIDQQRLLAESEFGKALSRREQAAVQALEAENARIESELIAEEQILTDRRPNLSADEFSALAKAFDEKVVRIRAEQDAKAREVSRNSESDRQEFFRSVVPVLGDLLVERKAVAIIDKSAIILSLTAIDVTEAAIAKVNDALRSQADGSDEGTSAVTGPDPASDVTSGTATAPAPAP